MRDPGNFICQQSGSRVCVASFRCAHAAPRPGHEVEMRILITNDDGIHAPGLDVCEQIARVLSDDVWIVAPETDQSGVSHSLSLNDPLRLRDVDARRFAVKGPPTDCRIMVVRHLMEGPPD